MRDARGLAEGRWRGKGGDEGRMRERVRGRRVDEVTGVEKEQISISSCTTQSERDGMAYDVVEMD